MDLKKNSFTPLTLDLYSQSNFKDLMKVENRGTKAKKNRKLTVQCTICGADMDCPESMQGADGHFCARCNDLMVEVYGPEELKKSHEDIAQHFEKCEEVSIQLMNVAFDSYWKNVQEYSKEHFDPENESLARDCYLQGATSMLGLLISAGMPPEFLDELAEGMREARKRMREGK